MNSKSWVNPLIILRLSLAAVYFYSGFDLVSHPSGWYWALRPLPQFIQDMIATVGVDTFLRIQGGIELIFAVVLVLFFLPRIFVRIVSFLSALQMAAILLMVGISLDTFRDFAILGNALALFVLSSKKNDY